MRRLNKKTRRQDLATRLFHPRRTGCTFPLRIDTLEASFTNPNNPPDNITDLVTGSILELFDPVHVKLSSFRIRELTVVGLDFVPWTRLRALSVHQIEWWYLLAQMPFFSSLPPDSLEVVYDMTDDVPEHRSRTDKIVEDLADEDDGLLEGEASPVKEVVIKVAEAGHEEGFRTLIREGLDREEIQVQDQDRMFAKIRFVVA